MSRERTEETVRRQKPLSGSLGSQMRRLLLDVLRLITILTVLGLLAYAGWFWRA